jgi:DNA helicase-2/ATP-dependent DNA helicase PcrA
MNSFRSETEANQAKDKAKEMLKVFLSWRVTNINKVISTEQKFSIDIAGIPINGSIDRVERDPDGDYEVIDFKTGSVYESNKTIKDNIQMNIYALATEKLYKKLPAKTTLFYLKKDKIIRNNIELSFVERAKQEIEKNIHSIIREEFEANPSYASCRKCDYQSICDSKITR